MIKQFESKPIISAKEMKFDCKMCPVYLKYNWNNGCSIIMKSTKSLGKIIEQK
jgi:hypothetical protein